MHLGITNSVQRDLPNFQRKYYNFNLQVLELV
jgi:hypothetical protein